MAEIVYERSGGFAGQINSLRITEAGQVKLSNYKGVVRERPLEEKERAGIQGFLESAQASGAAPEAPSQMMPDSYQIRLEIDGKELVNMNAPTLPTRDAEDPWVQFLGSMDALLDQEMQARREDGIQITRSDEPS